MHVLIINRGYESHSGFVWRILIITALGDKLKIETWSYHKGPFRLHELGPRYRDDHHEISSANERWTSPYAHRHGAGLLLWTFSGHEREWESEEACSVLAETEQCLIIEIRNNTYITHIYIPICHLSPIVWTCLYSKCISLTFDILSISFYFEHIRVFCGCTYRK